MISLFLRVVCFMCLKCFCIIYQGLMCLFEYCFSGTSVLFTTLTHIIQRVNQNILCIPDTELNDNYSLQTTGSLNIHYLHIPHIHSSSQTIYLDKFFRAKDDKRVQLLQLLVQSSENNFLIFFLLQKLFPFIQ